MVLDIPINKSILVLDDDHRFRMLVGHLLRIKGFEVIEASSAQEAAALIAGDNDPLLAIVDYKLPGDNGIDWIAQVRKSGRTFPIVIVSVSWCDQKTFHWLRNILKVSLVLRKPIVPELFAQQIENLLPLPARPLPLQAPMIESADARQVDLYKPMPESDYELKTAAEIVAQLKDLSMQSKLAAVKTNYANQLINSWKELSDTTNKFKQDIDNILLRNEAIDQAHKIRGTAGSVGFAQVGEAAGRIEDLLYGIDPGDPLKEVIWFEMYRALTAGETCVKEALGQLKAPVSETKENSAINEEVEATQSALIDKPRILTVDDDEVMTMLISNILSAESMVVRPLNEPILIMDAVEKFKPDLILLDVVMPGLSGYDLCGLLRTTEKWSQVPVIFLTSRTDQIGQAAAFLAGGNDFLNKPILAKELVVRVKAQLARSRSKRSPSGILVS